MTSEDDRINYLIERRKQQTEQRVELFKHFENKEAQERHEQYVKENVANGTIQF